MDQSSGELGNRRARGKMENRGQDEPGVGRLIPSIGAGRITDRHFDGQGQRPIETLGTGTAESLRVAVASDRRRPAGGPEISALWLAAIYHPGPSIIVKRPTDHLARGLVAFHGRAADDAALCLWLVS